MILGDCRCPLCLSRRSRSVTPEYRDVYPRILGSAGNVLDRLNGSKSFNAVSSSSSKMASSIASSPICCLVNP